MFKQEQKNLEERITNALDAHGIPLPDTFNWTALPFSGEWGLSLALFPIAAQEARQSGQRINVPARAQEIAAMLAEELRNQPEFARVEAVRGYLNLYFDTRQFSQRVVERVLEEGAAFGHGAPKGERILVEFSQPNTHKAFHVGHLRNMILGNAVCNILEAAGYEVIRANYIGDIGLHVIKWLWWYQKAHAEETPPGDKITRWMGDIYAEATRALSDNPDLETEVRALFARWDRRDPDIVALWERTRQWSLQGFEQVYAQLGIHFDHVYFESEVEESGKVLVDQMIADGIAVDERPDGPVIIRLDELLGLEKETYRVLVILRSDGTSLYATKDIPLALMKFEQYNPVRSVYVIDVRQSLYMQQIFKTLEVMGHKNWAERCYHLGYEIVNLPGNVTMSSREGTVVLLEDLLRDAAQRAGDVVAEKNPSLPADVQHQVAESVGLGAIFYTMLGRENNRIITFDWETALDFNGQAAPYIQYAHVRAHSILRRAADEGIGYAQNTSPQHELHPAEVQLIDLLSRLPATIQQAAGEFKPLHITNLAYELARTFTAFYTQCPVLSEPEQVRAFRLRLTQASKQALANLLALLGIQAPDVM
ncbi:MAG: arginine--tRNA ligase [Anaerolineales bacterium]